jgi:hypothetical protein
MAYEINECDQIRSPDRVCDPDSRTRNLVVLEGRTTGKFRQRTIEDQYEAVAHFKLNETVPESVAIHFETAKNLYLYSWCVYRFYSVAEQQAIASLEFALRERFPDFVAKEKKRHPRGMEPGLKRLFGYAVSNRFVRNEDFPEREQWARMRAAERYRYQKRQEALNAGLDSWMEDESEVVVSQDDLDYDWLSDLQEIIPNVRNSYAHGSFHLYPAPVLHTFAVVSGIINQIYPE